MKALVINVPGNRVGEPYFVPIDDMAKDGKAVGFIIADEDLEQLAQGCKVVLVDNYNRDKRYEGEFVKIETEEKARNGRQRYNVHFKSAIAVPYRYDAVKRQTGTSVINLT